ncbi:hypothetical protein LTR91_010594 [Friedmanniomyces endolithicus]|uniref:Uncharacterized protein n=1 Tax=Friedmanniomyces endolithicus TaxID=329885 RepID=A0AAN6F521_9PEZI|nr:hypothetical protein LTR35_018211 [Friedmanniomyces endolithicus]KAK0261962.1 hypothetical protein LTS00_018119 [Friedmanniomyces endolithicus]KAK0305037.1 hypothetical protein LTR82_016942 [Friedmanniomyces endolithicus]KAK0930070.1 hypothetical protein LTR29_016819 [Friedmanniomyces endolithicus]KAK0966370.1 hypothetical protein LTR54_018321 [Friedmanniomyces endolithicus]
MHKLVHAWGFDRLEAEEQGRYSQSSLALLEVVVRDGQLDPMGKARITPHISSNVARLREWHKGPMEVSKQTLGTMRLLAEFVSSTEQYQTEYELRAFEEAERARRKEQDEVGWLCSLSDLAAMLQNQGKYEAAEEMKRRALEGKEKVLRKEHRDTLTSVSNLALVLQDQGKYEAAEEMNRRALEGREKVLGKEHRDTLTSVYRLAYLLHQKADFTAALPLYERARSGYGRRLGPSHPTTMQCLDHMTSLQDWVTSPLPSLLDRHTERDLPKVRDEVRVLLKSTERNITNLGEDRPTVTHIRMLLSRLAMRFHIITNAVLTGDYNAFESVFFAGGYSNYSRWRAYIHSVNTQFSDDMRNQGQTLKVANETADAVERDSNLEELMENSEHLDQIRVTGAEFQAWIKKVRHGLLD